MNAKLPHYVDLTSIQVKYHKVWWFGVCCFMFEVSFLSSYGSHMDFNTYMLSDVN